MTISVVRRITGEDTQKIEQQVLKMAAYANENSEGTSTVMRHLSGDSSSIHIVTVYDSLAAHEADLQKRNEAPEWQALLEEFRKDTSNVHTSFHLHVGP